MPKHRIAQRRAGAYTITATPVDDDGATVELTGEPAAVVTDGAGATVTVAADPALADGVLSLVITAAEIPLLDTYRVVWTCGDWSGKSDFELVGGFLCEIADVRAEPGMGSATEYPTAVLRTARTKAETDIEVKAMYAFVPRGGRETIVVDGQRGWTTTKVMLRNVGVRRVYSVTVDGMALTADELAALTVYEYGTIVNPSGWVTGAVLDVHYEHGADEAPGAIVEGCARHTVRFAVKSRLGGRRTMESTELGTMRMTLATRVGETGDMDLDVAIKEYGRVRPTIG